ncbi:MAG TPA: DUF1015 domain-containing protein [Solirubrobacteraceae bacterium]|jgi:uncharacterized protein (DUF1015 family)|nr:DUF1015 domain-containing protein [Solirubrobacteraceae bacterium]
MAEIRPLDALRYDPADLQDAVAPPYDVIDAGMRARLAARSPHNVVAIDLPQGDDPYAEAARTFARWRETGVLRRDGEPALWALTQEYTGPDGERRTRSGFFAAVRVEDYGPGRIRPHERTHPGPREDRLNLTRATNANLSPIFSLYSDPERRAWRALEQAIGGAPPWAEVTDDDGTTNRLWRVADAGAIEAVRDALAGTELLIADGHHRYETARVYAQEAGTQGAQWVLMDLVALEDPGLTVFPTHRLVTNRGLERYEALAGTLREHFEIEEVTLEDLAPPPSDGPTQLGYLDGHFRRPFRLTHRGAPPEGLTGPLARFDTAILESLILKGPLGLTDDDIDHLRDFGYARDAEEAKRLVLDGEYDVAFLLRPPPVATIREVAAAGQNMPPKSTYFFPKVPTGLLFHSLDG